MIVLRKRLLFYLPFLLLLACEKEAMRPTLEVHEPSPEFHAERGDTLILDVEASSKDGLDRLYVSFLGKNFQQRVSPESYKLGGVKELRKEFSYPIGSPGSLPYGHQLRVMVESKEGKQRKVYISGNIEQEEAAFDKAFIVMRPGPHKVDVDTFENAQSGISDFLNLTSDYAGSATSSLHQEFLVSGSETGDLNAYDPKTGTQRWSFANQGSGTYPYFLDLFSDREGKWVISTHGTEQLNGFRGGPGPDYTADALDQYLIREAIKVQDRLLTEQEPFGTGIRKWVTYYASTGAVGTEKQIQDRDVVRILEGAHGKALVLANENGQGKLFNYDVQDRYFEKLAVLPSGALHDGIRMSDGRTLLVHDQGMMVYQRGSSILDVLSAAEPQAIAYDRVDDRIFMGEGSEFRVMDAQSGNVQWQHSCSDSIKAVHVLYEE